MFRLISKAFQRLIALPGPPPKALEQRPRPAAGRRRPPGAAGRPQRLAAAAHGRRGAAKAPDDRDPGGALPGPRALTPGSPVATVGGGRRGWVPQGQDLWQAPESLLRKA